MLRIKPLVVLLVAMLVGSLAAPGRSAPTPVPGGANQLSAIEGSVGKTLFNGEYRLKVITVRELSAQEAAALPAGSGAGADQKIILFVAMIRNGTNRTVFGGIRISYADADDVVQSSGISGSSDFGNTPPGAAQRFKLTMPVPKDFVPTKLIVSFAFEPKYKPFRIVLPKLSDAK